MIRSIRNIDFAVPAALRPRQEQGFTEQAPFLLWRLGNSQAIALACCRSRRWVGLTNHAEGGGNDRPE